MKITRIGPSFPLLTASTLGGGGGSITPSVGSGLTPVSNGSNGWAWGSNVQLITAGGSNVLGPFVNFAAGSNVTLTIDQTGSAASNTIRVHATSGAASFGSNSNAVSQANAPGASTDSSRADHVHLGVTSVAHSSNTYSGPVILAPGTNMAITSPVAGTFTLHSAGASGGGGSGALVLLEQKTASASATLDFTTCISSTYDEYVFEIVTIVPATTNTHLQIRMGTGGGPTYDSGANYGYALSVVGGGGTFNVSASTGATSIRVIHDINNTANYSASGTLKLFGPASAIYKPVTILSATRASDGHLYGNSGGGVYISTTAVTAVQFLMSAGNITSGIIRAYGITK